MLQTQIQDQLGQGRTQYLKVFLIHRPIVSRMSLSLRRAGTENQVSYLCCL